MTELAGEKGETTDAPPPPPPSDSWDRERSPDASRELREEYAAGGELSRGSAADPAAGSAPDGQGDAHPGSHETANEGDRVPADNREPRQESGPQPLESAAKDGQGTADSGSQLHPDDSAQERAPEAADASREAGVQADEVQKHQAADRTAEDHQGGEPPREGPESTARTRLDAEPNHAIEQMKADLKAELKEELKAELDAEHKAEIDSIRAENQELRQRVSDLEAGQEERPTEHRQDGGDIPDSTGTSKKGEPDQGSVVPSDGDSDEAPGSSPGKDTGGSAETGTQERPVDDHQPGQADALAGQAAQRDNGTAPDTDADTDQVEPQANDETRLKEQLGEELKKELKEELREELKAETEAIKDNRQASPDTPGNAGRDVDQPRAGELPAEHKNAEEPKHQDDRPGLWSNAKAQLYGTVGTTIVSTALSEAILKSPVEALVIGVVSAVPQVLGAFVPTMREGWKREP